jgi:hypothetical protein
MSGCGGGSGLDLAPVEGKVLLDGQPLAGVTVSFIPDAARDNQGPQSSGITNEQGEFTLKAPDGSEGAVLGFHVVTVTAPFREDGGSSPDGAGSVQQPTSTVKVPEKYTGYATTDLKEEVTSEEKEYTIELKSQ